MRRNSDQDSDTSDSYDTTKEIQKFLLRNLQLTPRRQLFEEYEKQLTIVQKNKLNNQQNEDEVPSEPMNKFEFNVIKELCEFRQKHPKECMTDLNHRRFRRAKEREEEFLHHAGVQRLMLNEGIIQSLMKADESSQKKAKVSCNKKPSSNVMTRSVHFAPDNSLALSYQKLK